MVSQNNKEIDLVQFVILLKFSEGGLKSISCYPPKLNENTLQNIGIKLVSLNVGEDSLISEGVSVIPFHQFKVLGLTYTFTVPIESSEKLHDAYFLALMVREKNPKFIFQNIDHLTDKLETTSNSLKQKGIYEEDAKIQIAQLYQYFVEFSKKYLEIKEAVEKDRVKTILAAALLYFHRKAGPIVFNTYPKKILNEKNKQVRVLTEDQSKNLCKELEIATHEGFFTRSYEDISHVSYYFEIHSDWARGKKEMLLLSYIFKKIPGKDIVDALHLKAIEFVEKMKVHPEIFKGFYSTYELEGYSEEEKKKTEKIKDLLTRWIKTLYITSLDVFQSSSMETAYTKTAKKR